MHVTNDFWHINETKDSASQAAADFIASRILTVLESKPSCHIILPGGNTPLACLQYLTKKSLPWAQCHWYPGDERVLAKGHPERNDTMLMESFWKHLPAGCFYPMPTELGLEKSLEVYRETVKTLDTIDIAFLGLGEDGHTASLFPGLPHDKDEHTIVPIYQSPKPPPQRLSFSLRMLSGASSKVILAFGEAKADILLNIMQGADLPATHLGDVDWFLDQAAAAKIITKKSL